MGGDSKVEAEDAADMWGRGRGIEDGGRGNGGVGTKDGENATGMACARNMEEPGSRPESARAGNTSIKVQRVIDDLRLCHYRTIKVVFTKPGD